MKYSIIIDVRDMFNGQAKVPLKLKHTEYGTETAHKRYSVFVLNIGSGFKITNLKLMRFFLSFPTNLADSDLYFFMHIQLLVMCWPDVYFREHLRLLEKCWPDWYAC
jgi:hypothetical protein